MSRGARKRKNYYAISRGRCPPCITTSWAFTNVHVTGFANNRFEGFVTFHKAKDWLLANMLDTQDSDSTFHFMAGPLDGPKSHKNEYDGYPDVYAVVRGRNTGVYSRFCDVQTQVKGYSGATYKAHATADAAYASLEYLRSPCHRESQRNEVDIGDSDMIVDDDLEELPTMMENACLKA